jgi:hypothetical protein
MGTIQKFRQFLQRANSWLDGKYDQIINAIYSIILSAIILALGFILSSKQLLPPALSNILSILSRGWAALEGPAGWVLFCFSGSGLLWMAVREARRHAPRHQPQRTTADRIHLFAHRIGLALIAIPVFLICIGAVLNINALMVRPDD